MLIRCGALRARLVKFEYSSREIDVGMPYLYIGMPYLYITGNQFVHADMG